jgi:prepilin-type N-terminal cleavage/methylation domain-containing protein
MAVFRRSRHSAFTLLEVLIVLVVIGVLAGMMIPSSSPDAFARLQAVAGILGNDIDYARNLAVINSDPYKITFDLALNQWVLRHSGTNTSLDNLPITALHRPSDPPKEQTVALANLPSVGGPVRLWDVWSMSNTPQSVTDVEFTPLGSTTRTVPTMVWLTVGNGAAARYIALRINPVTGLYWIENFQATTPNPGAFTGS